MAFWLRGDMTHTDRRMYARRQQSHVCQWISCILLKSQIRVRESCTSTGFASQQEVFTFNHDVTFLFPVASDFTPCTKPAYVFSSTLWRTSHCGPCGVLRPCFARVLLCASPLRASPSSRARRCSLRARFRRSMIDLCHSGTSFLTHKYSYTARANEIRVWTCTCTRTVHVHVQGIYVYI